MGRGGHGFDGVSFENFGNLQGTVRQVNGHYALSEREPPADFPSNRCAAVRRFAEKAKQNCGLVDLPVTFVLPMFVVVVTDSVVEKLYIGVMRSDPIAERIDQRCVTAGVAQECA